MQWGIAEYQEYSGELEMQYHMYSSARETNLQPLNIAIIELTYPGIMQN